MLYEIKFDGSFPLADQLNDTLKNELDRYKPGYALEKNFKDYFLKEEKQYRMVHFFPGIPRSDLALELVGKALRMKINVDKNPHYPNKRDYSRDFALPSDADVENIKASLEDGVLTVIIPRAHTKLAVRNIQIS